MRALAITLLLVGCNSPSYQSGRLRCAVGDRQCPSGFHCADDDACWANGSDPDLGAPDLTVDGPSADLSYNQCGWTLEPTNFDPCTAGSAGADWRVTTGAQYYSTTTGAGAGAPAGPVVTQSSGAKIRVVRVNTFLVDNSATLTVDGTMPLLLIVENAEVLGLIQVRASAEAAECNVRNGSGGVSCGEGGPGGSYGDVGGSGGPCNLGAAPAAGAASGAATLSPLRGGCAGGWGANPGSSLRATGGVPGGGLEISARVSLVVSGTIDVGGAGGSGGNGTTDTSCAGAACSSGGGGGGSGGAILLESPLVTITATARLCSNGGGGGGGGAAGQTLNADPGGSASCFDTPSSAGPGISPAGSGGSGGHKSHPDGYVGGGLSAANGSGGGAGGSVGRIRVHAGNATPIHSSALVTPTAVTN